MGIATMTRHCRLPCTLGAPEIRGGAMGTDGGVREELHFYLITQIFQNSWDTHPLWAPTIFIFST